MRAFVSAEGEVCVSIQHVLTQVHVVVMPTAHYNSRGDYIVTLFEPSSPLFMPGSV